jgi:hypothetical protein
LLLWGALRLFHSRYIPIARNEDILCIPILTVAAGNWRMKSKQYSLEHTQISIAHPPESVLENFVANLRVPVGKIEELLPLFREIIQRGDSSLFFESSQALMIVNQNIALVLDYLNSRSRNDISVESRKVVPVAH